MVFGHNTNIKLGTVTYHVQTENRGATLALIDTTVYFRGRVLHRRTNNYYDLLPLNDDSEQALKLRLDEQHRTVLEEMRNGTLDLASAAGCAGSSRCTATSARTSAGTRRESGAYAPEKWTAACSGCRNTCWSPRAAEILAGVAQCEVLALRETCPFAGGREG